MQLTLLSHPGCPYVQRVAIAMAEKGIPHERRDVPLDDKPGWFLAASPMGKIPVLLVDDTPIFESAVICEYLDETFEPRLHPVNPLERARHRAWMAYGTELLECVGAFYKATDADAMTAARSTLTLRLNTLEAALLARSDAGPWFSGEDFSLVDAVYAPLFRYFTAFLEMGQPDLLGELPAVSSWREHLAGRPSVIEAVPPNFNLGLMAYLSRQDTELARVTKKEFGTRSQ